MDSEGRTNKVPAEFVFNALKNRTPEMKTTSPAGDTRPSALEEISFDGTVWDDFGVQAYGLAYSVPGKEPMLVELGHGVPAKEKRQFHFLLRLEELGVQPDDLLSWFIWADDIGPDAKARRTTGDLFFAEVRPFEQIFRQGQSMASESAQQQRDQSGGSGGPAERLAEMQKQIISATWNVFRQQGLLNPAAKPGSKSDPMHQAKTVPCTPRVTAHYQSAEQPQCSGSSARPTQRSPRADGSSSGPQSWANAWTTLPVETVPPGNQWKLPGSH